MPSRIADESRLAKNYFIVSADDMPDDLPVILVPGQLMTRPVWEPILPQLEGRSKILFADIVQDDSIAGMANRLLAGVSGRFDLVGFAMGGFVAFEVLKRSPERVRSLVLMSTLAEADTEVQRERRRGYSALVEKGAFGAVVDQRIPILFAETFCADEDAVRTVRDMAYETGPSIFLRQQKAIMERADSRAILGRIRCPTLIVRGSEDAITSAADHQLMATTIPHAASEIVEGAGHMVTLEAPERLGAIIGCWIGRQHRSGATD